MWNKHAKELNTRIILMLVGFYYINYKLEWQNTYVDALLIN